MSVDPKDRFGDKLRDKEKGEEERYFAKRERELIERLKRTRGSGEAEEATGQAEMRCPRCSSPLGEKHYERGAVERCPRCGAEWREKSELEAGTQPRRESWFRRFLRGRLA